MLAPIVTGTAPSMGIGAADVLNDALGDVNCIVAAHQVVEQNREFIAIAAGHHILRPHRFQHAMCRDHQQPVPLQVAKLIVHTLETIQVDEQHGEVIIGMPAALDGAFQSSLK